MLASNSSENCFRQLEKELLVVLEMYLARYGPSFDDSKPTSSCQIQDLPTDLLQEIFRRVPFRDRWLTVPLVCKRWSEVALTPGPMWQHVSCHEAERLNLVKLFRRLNCHRGDFVTSIDITLYLQPVMPGKGIFGITLAAMCTNIEALKLYGCIHGADIGHLSALVQLRDLALRKVTGPAWSSAINGLSQLTKLERFELTFSQSSTLASRTLIGCFPEGICNLQKLKHLSLSVVGFRGTIRQLPSSISQLRNLTTLALVGFDFREVCAELGTLTNLVSLDLSSSKLDGTHGVPHTVSRLQSLTELNLHIGFRGPFPRPLRSLGGLRKLNIAYNPLSEHGLSAHSFDFLQNFSVLEELDMSFNYIVTFPTVLCGITTLKRLDLHINDLTSITPGPYLHALSHIRVSHNKFKELPKEFLLAKHLEVLNFSHQKAEVVLVEARLLRHVLELPLFRELTISKFAVVTDHLAGCTTPIEEYASKFLSRKLNQKLFLYEDH